jgi:multiple sugar transport system ATP-binding protein
MANLQVRGVHKRFGATPILHGVDIDVADGEFLTLVGPSGCGKSTLLRLIAGLEEISDGEIQIGGRRVNEVPPKDRDIAMVFQNYALYPHMRVSDNMAFALEMRRESKSNITARVKSAASILGIESLLDRYPRQLSGGQRQRVAMGRAIVRDPQVFLFDEPLSNLDAKLRVAMRAEIKDLHQRLKTTTIYVTHDQIEAMTMADRIVVMRAGFIEQIGTPLELYDCPANVFVATFIGSPAMNLLAADLKRAETGGELRLASGQSLKMPSGLKPPDSEAVRPIHLGIRPEHVDLAQDGVPATIVVIEPTGSETQVLVRIAESDETVMICLRERLPLVPGESVRLRLRLDKAHLFDRETGMRIET